MLLLPHMNKARYHFTGQKPDSHAGKSVGNVDHDKIRMTTNNWSELEPSNFAKQGAHVSHSQEK